MLVQLLLGMSLAGYFPIVNLVKASAGKTCLGKTSCAMMLLLIYNSLRLSVRPSRLNNGISVTIILKRVRYHERDSNVFTFAF